MEKLRDRLARRMREMMAENPAMDVQTKVALKAGVSQSTVQRVLAKDQAATVDVIEDLARAFDIKPARYFMLDKDEITLLRAFSHLSTEHKATIMAYIDVVAKSGEVQGGRPKLNFGEEQSVSPGLRAAVEKASRERPSSSTKKDTDDRRFQAVKPRRRKA